VEIKDAESQLDNPIWYALRGAHAHLAETAAGGRVVRYPREVSIFAAVDTLDDEAWKAQAEFVGPEGVTVLFRDHIGPLPAGWSEEFRGGLLQMVAGDLSPAPAIETVALGADDADEMLALTQLTEPGPFLARTHELGHYRGVKRDGRLMAMAGERFRVAGWTEISAVCTHPDAQRQGLGAAMTLTLAEAIRSRGDTPFLHVLDTNETAIRLYEALGFRVRRKATVIAAQWLPDGPPTGTEAASSG
jgi:ribosomal protein S18 acetylase RimI-like enzyme